MLIAVAALLLTQSSGAPTNTAVQYLSSLQDRWDVSDLVCVGDTTSPARTGQTRKIDGYDRDELSSEVEIETCFKGLPTNSKARILGYSVFATKDLDSSQGYGYAGPPVGFVSEGRDLLFLRRTKNPDQFEVAVPVYKTAIQLADRAPDITHEGGKQPARVVVTKELEAAAVQFDDTNLEHIGYLFDLLGATEGIAELSRFEQDAPLAIQRDIAVAILSRGQVNAEPEVILLLADQSAPMWKRQNAAFALAEYGTEAATGPLEKIASQPRSADDQDELCKAAASSLERLRHRLGARPTGL